MTNNRRHAATFGASFIVVGANALLLTFIVSFLNPLASNAVEATPAPVGIEVLVPVIEVPPAPTVGAIIPVGAAADTAQVEVVVSGLLPYSYFELYLRSTPTLVANGFADSTGTFTVTITLPTTLEVGNHSLEVKATDAAGQPYVITVSQFAITADRRLAGAGPGSSLISSTTNTSGSGASSTQTTQTDPTKAAEALGSNPLDVGGILFAGGVVASTFPVATPNGGTVILAMTVKNVSNTTFDSRLNFWLTSPLGDTLAEFDPISVAGLAPGETRTVQATLTSVGQWPVMTAHGRLTPPAAVEGTDLSAVTRDTVVWMWPIFALIMLGLLVAGYALWRFLPAVGSLRRAERPHPLEPAASAMPKKPRAATTPNVAPAVDNATVTKPAPKKPRAPRTPKVVPPGLENREDNA